jgi:hypothetical protein
MKPNIFITLKRAATGQPHSNIFSLASDAKLSTQVRDARIARSFPPLFLTKEGGPRCAERIAILGYLTCGGLGKPLGRGEELCSNVSPLLNPRPIRSSWGEEENQIYPAKQVSKTNKTHVSGNARPHPGPLPQERENEPARMVNLHALVSVAAFLRCSWRSHCTIYFAHPLSLPALLAEALPVHSFYA